MPTTNPHHDALLDTFMLAFDNFATDPSEVARLATVGNSRYAREILATLVHADLLTHDAVNGDEEVWQVINPGTYDSATREQALAVIHQFLGTNPTVNPTPKKATVSKSKTAVVNPNLAPCPCGCGLTANSRKTTYRPGHDARHAGQIARAILAGGSANLLEALPTPALKAKAEAQVERGNMRKAAPKKSTGAGRKGLIGAPVWIKVGRWVKKGEVSSTTVDANGKVTGASEVVAITYTDAKGAAQTVQVDSSKHRFNETWGFGKKK